MTKIETLMMATLKAFGANNITNMDFFSATFILAEMLATVHLFKTFFIALKISSLITNLRESFFSTFTFLD